MTKTVALEAAETAITCTASCPGCVRTSLVERQIRRRSKAHGVSEEQVIREAIPASRPTKRFVEPGQLAGVVVFLCSDAASSMKGAAPPIEGGWGAH